MTVFISKRKLEKLAVEAHVLQNTQNFVRGRKTAKKGGQEMV